MSVPDEKRVRRSIGCTTRVAERILARFGLFRQYDTFSTGEVI